MRLLWHTHAKSGFTCISCIVALAWRVGLEMRNLAEFIRNVTRRERNSRRIPHTNICGAGKICEGKLVSDEPLLWLAGFDSLTGRLSVSLSTVSRPLRIRLTLVFKARVFNFSMRYSIVFSLARTSLHTWLSSSFLNLFERKLSGRIYFHVDIPFPNSAGCTYCYFEVSSEKHSTPKRTWRHAFPLPLLCSFPASLLTFPSVVFPLTNFPSWKHVADVIIRWKQATGARYWGGRRVSTHPQKSRQLWCRQLRWSDLCRVRPDSWPPQMSQAEKWFQTLKTRGSASKVSSALREEGCGHRYFSHFF